MPKLKQPTSLEKIAFDVVLESVVRCCDELSIACEDSSQKLRQGISVIKKKVCKHIPSPLLADFCCMFLDKFFLAPRSACHKKAAVEIVMDLDIVGLRCEAPNLAFFDLKDRHRIRRLMHLDLACAGNTINTNLDNLNLNDLTTLIFPTLFTDFDLVIIGLNCPKLKVVKVWDSKSITDNGLGALSPCTELRVIDIVSCSEVSHIGINDLLSMHEKLEDFACGSRARLRILAFSHLDLSTQCPSMNRFYIQSGVFSDTDLHSIVAKFPNLIYLGIDGFHMVSLSMLKSLNKLAQLEFNSLGKATTRDHPDNLHQMWTCLIEILPCIGMNITSLKISNCRYFYLRQECLNSIYNFCPNIEQLKFNFKDDLLVMPLFEKLTELSVCRPFRGRSNSSPEPVLEFDKMLRLETLMFVGLGLRARVIESIIFDDFKFPNLSLIKTYHLQRHEVLELERIVRIKNLNLKMKNHSIMSFSNSTENY